MACPHLIIRYKKIVEVMKKAAGGRSIGIFIGPEGGFERSEVEAAMEAGQPRFPLERGSYEQRRQE